MNSAYQANEQDLKERAQELATQNALSPLPAAFQGICRLLEPLESDQRTRVLEAAAILYGVEL